MFLADEETSPEEMDFFFRLLIKSFEEDFKPYPLKGSVEQKKDWFLLWMKKADRDLESLNFIEEVLNT